MLRIVIPGKECWDERINEFVYPEDETLELEHSLVSISKWESKWCKAFLSRTEKTDEETIDYIRCMTLNQDVDPDVYYRLTRKDIEKINDYIQAPMTATSFPKDEHGKGSRETVTAELIYYWMIALQIPFECQYWHLNKLLTLVKVCNIKNTPPKKRSKRDIARNYSALNAARCKQLNTTG